MAKSSMTVIGSSIFVGVLSFILFYVIYVQNGGNVSSIFPGITKLIRVSKSNSTSRSEVRSSYLGHHCVKKDKSDCINPTGNDHNHDFAASQYFTISTEFFEWGWGDAIHMSPLKPGLSFKQSMNIWELRFINILNVTQNSKVVDMGCGIGGPLRRIIEFTGASVTGVTNVDYQIKRANQITADRKKTPQFVADRATYIYSDYNNVSMLPSNSYDVVYFMESLSHSNNRSIPIGEAFRLLKPGGVVGAWQWMLKPNFDYTDDYQMSLKRGMELGGGLSNLNKPSERTEEFAIAGFKDILLTYDMDALGQELNWKPFWVALNEGHDIQSTFTSSYFGRYLTMFIAWFTEFIGLAAKGTYEVSQLLEHCADSAVKAGQADIFTPLWLHVARKPLE